MPATTLLVYMKKATYIATGESYVTRKLAATLQPNQGTLQYTEGTTTWLSDTDSSTIAVTTGPNGWLRIQAPNVSMVNHPSVPTDTRTMNLSVDCLPEYVSTGTIDGTTCEHRDTTHRCGSVPGGTVLQTGFTNTCSGVSHTHTIQFGTTPTMTSDFTVVAGTIVTPGATQAKGTFAKTGMGSGTWITTAAGGNVRATIDERNVLKAEYTNLAVSRLSPAGSSTATGTLYCQL